MSSPTRDSIRHSIADRLLTSLEDLVRRHRALGPHAAAADSALRDSALRDSALRDSALRDSALHAELIAAEVAHELSVARSALHRHPPLR